MESAAALNVVVENIQEMNDIFTDVATAEVLSPVLVLAGTVLIVLAMAVFGVLTLGAVGSLFSSS